MVYQLRIYTINRGMMDSWISLFNEHIWPLHERLGIPVQNSWSTPTGPSSSGCAASTTRRR